MGIRATPLAEAIASFERARSETSEGKGQLRRESRLLAELLSVNGNVYVHHLRSEHMVRAFGAEPSTSELVVLQIFFRWCRRWGWLGRKAQPLRQFEELPRFRDPLDGVYLGDCSRCHSHAVITRVEVVAAWGDKARLRLCRRCRNRATLPELLELGGHSRISDA